MRDYVEKLEIENFWEDEYIDPLAKRLDDLIKKGEYKWVFGQDGQQYTITLEVWWTYALAVKWY